MATYLNHYCHYCRDILPSHYKWKEYCPIVFKNIRERFHISDESYINSLTTESIEAADLSTGKSGAKFYLSHDHKYMLKTVTSEDIEVLHNILSDYHKHIVETKGNTLLPHILGLYRLTVEDKENYIMVARNVFNKRYRIHTKYDIKGSTVDRAAKQKEKEKDSPTLKDNDLIHDGRLMNIGPEAKKAFIDRLTLDVGFLTGLNLMDYSLLIGIHDVERSLNEDKPDSDQDQENFSPNEDTEDQDDTDDDQLNATATHTPPESPAVFNPYDVFGIQSAGIYLIIGINLLLSYFIVSFSS